MSGQLDLGLDAVTERVYTCCAARCSGPHAPGCTNPNLAFFDASGQPRRLMWCSDTARLGGPCPYESGERDARHAPTDGCCKVFAPPVTLREAQGG